MADNNAAASHAASQQQQQQRQQLTDAELEAVRRFEEKVVRIHPGRDPRNAQRMLYRVVAFVGPGANLLAPSRSTSLATPRTSNSAKKRESNNNSQRLVPDNNDDDDDDQQDDDYSDAALDDDDDDDDNDEDSDHHQGSRNRGGAHQVHGRNNGGGRQQPALPAAALAAAAATARDADEDDVNEEKETITFGDMEVLGAGSFGSVYRISLLNDASYCAIKKVFQDVRYKNRELSIMRRLRHGNIIKLRYYFYTKSSASSQQHQQQQNQHHPQQSAPDGGGVPSALPGVDLNLILEYVPETLYAVVKHFYSREKRPVPPMYTAVFMYQIFKALNYLHNRHGVCHRDIKPQNILCSIETGVCKVCDFGSAKRLRDGEANVAYICSRYYRAPELIFGLSFYTCAIDLWSTACVMAEVMLGSPIFPGNQPLDQIVEIIKIRGTPTADEIMAMNPKYENRNLPQVQRRPLRDIFHHHHHGTSTGHQSQQGNANSVAHYSAASNVADGAILDAATALLDQLFSYDPTRRPGALDILLHTFFDCLRLPEARLPNGHALPVQHLFTFTRWEQSCMRNNRMRQLLMPEHTRSKLEPQRVPQQQQNSNKRSSPEDADRAEQQTSSSKYGSSSTMTSSAGGNNTTTHASSSGGARRRSSRPHDQQQQPNMVEHGNIVSPPAATMMSMMAATNEGGRNPPMPTPRPAAAGAGMAPPQAGIGASIAGSIRRRSGGGGSRHSNNTGGEHEAAINSGRGQRATATASQPRAAAYQQHHHNLRSSESDDQSNNRQHSYAAEERGASSRTSKKRSKG